MKFGVKTRFSAIALAAAMIFSNTAARAANYEVTVQNDIVFAEHDGTKLLADLYSPKG